MLFPQGYGRRFGSELITAINNPVTQQVDIATAWVRASGVRHLLPGFRTLLGRGGALRVVVGLDCDNTSIEGLQSLLSLRELATGQDVSLWVRHNEAGLIFHPKMYAFRTAHACTVYVGSNNMTEAGLFQNEELSGRLLGDRGSELEKKLDAYLARLTHAGDGLARRLDDALMTQLVDGGYVEPEARLAGKTAARARRTQRGSPLFGRRNSKPPAMPSGAVKNVEIEPDLVEAIGRWQRVFLRLRLSRRTQAQIPVPVARAIRRQLGLLPVDGPISVVLRHENREQEITPTYAKRKSGEPNTYKFEAFAPTGHALLKIEAIAGRAFVEKVDGAEAVGKTINEYLLAGLKEVPKSTFQTRSNLNQATLYRFD